MTAGATFPVPTIFSIFVCFQPFMFLIATVLLYGIGQCFAVGFTLYLVTFGATCCVSVGI